MLASRIRYELGQLKTRDAHVDFQMLCAALARVTITPNILFPTGPVSAGGDRGRDFETYWTASQQVRTEGAALGVEQGHKVVGICTLQQTGLRAKVLDDVAKVCSGSDRVDRVVSYSEFDIVKSRRAEIQDEVCSGFGIDIDFFGGEDIADQLAVHHRVLAGELQRCLRIATDGSLEHVPRELPATLTRFVNRDAELKRLDEVLVSSAAASEPVVALVTGMRGVGKTALAEHWTRSVRGRFSDGDLFVDFGPSADRPALDPSDVLAGLLRDLGLPSEAVPDVYLERSKLYNRLTAGKRLLMFADNVADPAQINLTKPSGSGSVVIAASELRLEELVHRGARRLAVEPLGDGGAESLLREKLVPERPMPSREEIRELIELCGGLPIALNVCASRLVARPELTVRELLDGIRSASDRLAAMPEAGPHSVRAAFEAAYEALDPDCRVLYRRLGLHPGPSFTAAAAARLAQIGPEDAARRVEALHDRHLVVAEGGGRYSVHSLVHQHMQASVERHDDPPIRRRLVAAVADWYLGVVRRADRVIVEERLRLSELKVRPPAGAPQLGSVAAALKWFSEEHDSVLAVMAAARDHGMSDRVWAFAEALWPLVSTQKRHAEWMLVDKLGIDAARTCGHPAAEARLRSHLARAHAEQGDHGAARAEMEKAAAAAETAGVPALSASVTEFGGVCALLTGDTEAALAAFDSTREQMAGLDNARGVALADYLRAGALVESGRPEPALAALDRAEPVFETRDDPVSVGKVGRRRGQALIALGRGEEASEALAHTAALLEEHGLELQLARVQELRAKASQLLERTDEAREHLCEAQRLLLELGHTDADRLQAELSEVLRPT